MSLIKNLIKESETKCDVSKNSAKNEETKIKPVVKSATDLQRLKLEKLMRNPDKPVIIPEHKKDKDFMQSVPTFVRNVMGSSAGAGSGEFHVYRHLRRKEYARQKMIQSKSRQELLDDEYQEKVEENRRKAEEKTAKKRAKRLRKKCREKKQKRSIQNKNCNSEESSKETDSENDTNIKGNEFTVSDVYKEVELEEEKKTNDSCIPSD